MKQAGGDIPGAIKELELPGSPGDLRRIELLEKHRDTGKTTPFVHELDARAHHPVKLVVGLKHHPATDKQAKFYFISEAKNCRTVRGEARNGQWRPDEGWKEVQRGEDVVGYVRRLSYVIKVDSKHKSQHWVMMEYTLANDGNDQFVLSVVHYSGYKKRKCTAAASSNSRAAPAGTVEADQYGQQIRDGEVAEDGEKTSSEFIETSSREFSRGPSVVCLNRMAVDLDRLRGDFSYIPDGLQKLTDAVKEKSCDVQTEVCEIDELRHKELHYSITEEREEPPKHGRRQLMRLAREGGIQSILTVIAFESNGTILEISKRGLDQHDFEVKVFSIVNGLGIPPVCMESMLSLKLFPSARLSHEMIQQKLGNIVPELEKFAHVTVLQQRSIISLIGNAEKSALILSKLANVLLEIDVKYQNLEQKVSKVTTSITFVVSDSEAKRCVEAIKSAFSAEKSSSAPAASSDSKTKRKVAEEEDHPEAPPAGRRQTNPPTPSSVLQQTNEEVQPGADVEFNSNCPVPVNSSSRAISSEPNHPESPQDRTGLATCLGPDDNMELDVNSTWYDKFYTRAHDHPDAPPTGRRQTNPPTPSDEDNDEQVQGPDLGSSNCPIPEDDEEVQLGADMEFNNCPVQVNSSSTAITHPKMTGTSDLADLFTEKEKQMIDGVLADQYRYNASELPTEVMGFADFATPAYQTFFPTEDSRPIPLGEEENTYVEVGLWEDEICIQD